MNEINSQISQQLSGYRRTIDNIDAALVFMLAERFRCTDDVGVLKAVNSLPAVDAEREKSQVERLRRLATGAGLDPEFVEAFFTVVVSQVVRNHQYIAQRLASAPKQMS